jgi:glycerate kinase
MKIIVAPDSFKESLSAVQVAAAISAGLEKVVPESEIIRIPFADGGEGTVEALVNATHGKIVPALSADALNRPIQSFYGVLGDGKTAVIEMAAASGLEKLTPDERNPLNTSTYGTGLLLKAVLDAGYTSIIIGIGGSATNDGGAGMAQALGFGLFTKNGNPIGYGGGALADLETISNAHVHPLLQKTNITVACDVQNPLLGEHGATQVYGPQKGATAAMLELLEQNLTHFSQILNQEFESDWSKQPGAGAAGGLGFGLLNFCHATIVSGFELISQLTRMEEQISSASLVLTGEGKIDEQTIFGKTVSGVSKLGKKHSVPVIALTGSVEGNLNDLYNQGLTSVFAIGSSPMSLEESKANAYQLLTATSEQIMRLVNGIKKY